ncbi:MAG: UDP-N-acetylmuramoyl-L-alanyl-D-glutamate--2,6-diaminopimelate ligase [Elusimicrobiales bacterium]|nr:UDP-N-acetylmuramoyl-L-alanyl-D-glutamate--2,6-diaminopimelate ligase [Elusimicrobiales bacterium]
MKLSEVLKDTNINIKKDIEIKGIEIDSKKIKPGYIFFAIKGEKTDGNIFIDEAIKNGASIIITEKETNITNIPVIKVSDINLTLSKASKNFHQNPTSKMKIIGITGTKGKTSVSHFIEQMLISQNIKTGVIGTINYRTYKRIIMEAQNTTPYPPLLDQIFIEFLKDEVNFCIMEVSSHALKLKKVDSVEFDICIFTNLQSDHLDFHKTIDDYKNSKIRLFHLIELSPKNEKTVILNIDDPVSKEIISIIKKSKIITFGIKQKADLYASNIKINLEGSNFDIHFQGKSYNIKTQLCGIYNIYNILAATSLVLTVTNDFEKIIPYIENLTPVKGRLEKISSPKGFNVYIDYAHTEDSLKETLKTLKQIPHERIITVFGCGGDRDPTKRAPMGKIAAIFSDFVIITSDNPRTEDPLKIINEIEKGIKELNYSNYYIIPDRRDAIIKAIEIAKKGDIILIAGKGHEEYQITAQGKIYFSDREEVLKALEKNL